MRLDVIVQDQVFGVEVPDELLTEAEEFFRRMDADMDRGWQALPDRGRSPAHRAAHRQRGH